MSEYRSSKAFEITKNVKESNAETLLNVRSGGVVGELREQIEQLQAKNKELKTEVKQWKMRTDEAANIVADYEELKNVLEKILKREDCVCNSYEDCDCTWELVCKTIDPKRWAKLQAMKGGENNEL